MRLVHCAAIPALAATLGCPAEDPTTLSGAVRAAAGAIDSAQLRAKGVQAYGISSPGTDQDAEGSHGNDERVSIEGLGQFIEFVYRAVVEVAAAR